MTENYVEDEESFINSFSKKKIDDYTYEEKSIIPIEIFYNIFSEKSNQACKEEIEDIEEEKIINKDRNNNNYNKNNDNHIQIIINNDKKIGNFSSSTINSKNKTDINSKIVIPKHKKNILNNTKKIKKIKIFGVVSNKISLGRKRKDIIRDIVGHDKFSDDNLIRKVKCTLIDILFNLINKLLKKYYSNNLGDNRNKKELLKMNQNQIVCSKVDYNRNFILKTLKEIFSCRISTKYTKYYPEHNKNIINTILKEKNRHIKMIFENILNLTFLDCLEHFRGTKHIKDLDGMTNLNEFCNKFENDPDYNSQFKFFFIYINRN